MRARTLAALLAPVLACFNPSGNTATTDPGSTGDDPSTSSDDSTGPTTGGSTGADASSSGTTGVEPVCGDGEVEGDEECDPGPGDPLDNCDLCRLTALRVFVTSVPYSAVAVAPAAADELCKAHAGVDSPLNSFFAWIGADARDPGQVLALGNPFGLPYVRTDGVMVADNPQDVLDGTLLAPINVDETGTPVIAAANMPPCLDPGQYAWTGAGATGMELDPDCNGWTTNSLTAQATVGDLLATTEEWTGIPVGCQFDCSSLLRIYCFEKVL